MIKKNSRGFTIIELLVAIFIFTIVLFIGYRVINQYIYSENYQGKINRGQLTSNNMNEYLTKDLEQATSIKVLLDGIEIADTKPSDNDNSDKDNELQTKVIELVESKLNDENIASFKYEYVIRDNSISESDDSYIKYVAEVINSDSNRKYSILRIDKNGLIINFINNQILKEDKLPFMITGNNPYNVVMKYNGKKNKIVSNEFKVTSRYLLANSDGEEDNEAEDIPMVPIIPIPKPPTIQVPNGYEAIGFWTADKEKCIQNNLYTWINGVLSPPGKQDENIEDVFTIKAQNAQNENANSGHSYTTIGYENIVKAYLNKVTTIHPNNINNIYIYVSKNTTLSKLNDSWNTVIGIENVTKSQDGYNLQGGENGTLYKCTLSSKNKKTFNITGLLSIDDKTKIDSGYAIIYYGTQDTDIPLDDNINGDLIYEYTKGELVSSMYTYYRNLQVNMYNYNLESPLGTAEKNKNEDFYENFNFMLKTTDGKIEQIHSGGYASSMNITSEEIKKITGINVKLEGNLTVEGFTFPGYDQMNLEPNKIYPFRFTTQNQQNQHNIGGHVRIAKNNVVNQKYRIIIDFIE